MHGFVLLLLLLLFIIAAGVRYQPLHNIHITLNFFNFLIIYFNGLHSLQKLIFQLLSFHTDLIQLFSDLLINIIQIFVLLCYIIQMVYGFIQLSLAQITFPCQLFFQIFQGVKFLLILLNLFIFLFIGFDYFTELIFEVFFRSKLLFFLSR